MTIVRVAEAFSPYLGGRYRSDGPWSGEEFRDDVLVPHIRDAIANKDSITVVLDGVAGVPSSFLEEAFGGLLRTTQWPLEQLERTVKIEAEDPDLWPYVGLARRFMNEEHARQA